MTDTIVYLAVTNGGGIDGLDRTDKGGRVMAAALSRDGLDPKWHVTGWYTITPVVEDLEKVALAAWRSLTPVQRLALTSTTGKLTNLELAQKKMID